MMAHATNNPCFLIIDAGNNRIKLGMYQDNKLVKKTVLGKEDSFPSDWLDYTFTAGICSNSGSAFILNHLPAMPMLWYNHSTALPILNAYATPQTLGTDRIAGVIGGMVHKPKSDILSIDAGTCITYDALIDGKYLGGAISLGLHMRHAALHHFTASLPEVPLNPVVSILGNSTESALQSGVFHGMLYEIQGFINEYRLLYPNIEVFMTGGDLQYFENHLKSSIFVAPNLVLDGLHTILNYNLPTLLGA